MHLVGILHNLVVKIIRLVVNEDENEKNDRRNCIPGGHQLVDSVTSKRPCSLVIRRVKRM